MGFQAGNAKEQSWLEIVGLFVALLVFGYGAVIMIGITVALLSDAIGAGADKKEEAWIAVAIISGPAGCCLWFTYRVARRLFRPGSRLLPKRLGNPFVCNSCGCEAPTIYVSLHKHMGVIILKFHGSVRGHFCQRCISKTFWRWTLLTFVLGWWGLVSLVITPIVLVSNLVMYVRSLSMPDTVGNLIAPVLTESDVYRVHEIHDHIVERLRSGIALDELSTEVSQIVGVTPGQAYIYVAKLHEMELHVVDQTATVA